MTFNPGKNKTGGRSRGTLNKRSEEVLELLNSLGCDPIGGMAKIAMDEAVEVQIRAQMFKELAQYIAPRLKAVDHTSSDGSRSAFVQVTSADIKNAFLLDPMLRKPSTESSP